MDENLNSKKIIYFGDCLPLCKILHEQYQLVAIFCENSRKNKEIELFAKLKNINLVTINNREHLSKISDYSCDLGISYNFGLIFDQAQIDSFPKGILNFHPGFLPEFRSRHPIHWAFLKDRFEIGFTAHLIDSAVDKGYVVAEASVKRDRGDSIQDIQDRLINLLVDNFAYKAIEKIFETQLFPKMKSSPYLSNFSKLIEKIEPSDWNSKDLINIFMTQVSYGGLKYKNKKYKSYQIIQHIDSEDTFKCKDGIFVKFSK